MSRLTKKVPSGVWSVEQSCLLQKINSNPAAVSGLSKSTLYPLPFSHHHNIQYNRTAALQRTLTVL